MSTVVVLGGCGAVGSVAVKTLARDPTFTKIVIGDTNRARAQALIAELGPAAGVGSAAALPPFDGAQERGGSLPAAKPDSRLESPVSFVPVDAGDERSVRSAIANADIVLNCVGPFYKTVRTVLDAVLAERKNYVDICDDVDVTMEILQRDAEARRAGITALIGMGASPGVTNLFAKYIAETQLDTTDSIDIFHCHGGEPIEGPGVIGHRFHCMSIDIPMFLDGELKYVRYFEPDGIALRQTFDFPILGPTPLYPYPHPEQVTLPRFLKVRQVTNKGSVLPIEYYQLTAELCRLGLSSREPLVVNGQAVVPYDFAVALLIRERDRLLAQQQFGVQRGCMSVIVKGRKDGEPREVRVHMGSSSGGLGEGTGMPAAIGVMLMQQGKITTTGVLPPEGCVDPADFLIFGLQVMRKAGMGGGGSTLRIETIRADGSVSGVDL